MTIRRGRNGHTLIRACKGKVIRRCSLEIAPSREKLVKIGAKIVMHSPYVTFQMAEVAVPRDMFAEILRLIAHLRVPPTPA